MKHSDTIGKIAEALCAAQAQFRSAIKDSTNPAFRSKYADLASYIEACRAQLASHKLALTQGVEATGQDVTVTTMLIHVSGEWLESALTLRAVKPDPQGIGSAITYGRRYGLAAMLNLAADDDDGQAASYRRDEEHHHAPKPGPMPAVKTAQAAPVAQADVSEDRKIQSRDLFAKLSDLAGKDFATAVWHADANWDSRVENLSGGVESIRKIHKALGQGRGEEAVTDVLAQFLKDKKPDVAKRALQALEAAAYGDGEAA